MKQGEEQGYTKSARYIEDFQELDRKSKQFNLGVSTSQCRSNNCLASREAVGEEIQPHWKHHIQKDAPGKADAVTCWDWIDSPIGTCLLS